MEFIISEEKITEWKRLAEDATPGPWDIHSDGKQALIGHGPIPTASVGYQWEPMAVADAEFIAVARLAVPALLAEREQLLIEIRERDESDALFEKLVMSAVRRAGELLGQGNYDSIDHAAERVVKERDELRVHLAKWAQEYERWVVENSVNSVKLAPEIERLRYELRMQTIRTEHAESDIGGVREEQWYKIHSKELEAEVERLRAIPMYGDREVSDLKVNYAISQQSIKNLEAERDYLRAELDDIHLAMREAAEMGARAMQNELAIGVPNLFANELQARIVEGAIRVLDPALIARQVVDSEVGVDHNEDKP